MMTQVNELDSDKHLNMIQTEFIDAIGRIADRVAIPPLFQDDENDMGETDLGKIRKMQDEYRKLPLEIKIESLLFRMIEVSCSKDYVETMSEKMAKYHGMERKAVKKTRYVAVGGPYQSENVKDLPDDMDVPDNIK